MSPSPQLTPPGSSSYNSPTMFVGDGTWDTQRNTFLLPNLQGLNFATMQYNGMGNRFAEMDGYASLIRGHGIVAAIVFLFIVPAAIIINRFYRRNPWMALRIHIWLHILTLLLTTVVFVLGYMAVGPARALTNPHHGIGLAIYLMVIVQFFGGWWVHSREKRKRALVIPLKVVLHKWFGRTIALLGLAQVPLGLTLWGSPSYLFILYSLVVFGLITIYFILSYQQEKDQDRDSEYSRSHATGSRIDAQNTGGGLGGGIGKYVAGGAAALGLGALASRLGRRDRRDNHDGSHDSGSYLSEEKYSERPEKRGGFMSKFLGLGAVAGIGYWFGKFLGKRQNKRDQENASYVSSREDTLERVEEGRPLPPAQQPLNGRPGHQRTNSEYSEGSESYLSESPEQRRKSSHGLRNAVLGVGAFGFAREALKRRREKKEQRRIDELRQQEIEAERIARANSRRLTGDGTPRRKRRNDSFTSDDMSNSPAPLLGGASGAAGAAMASGALGMAMASRERQEQLAGPPPVPGAPPVPVHAGVAGSPLPMPSVPHSPHGRSPLHQHSSASDFGSPTRLPRNGRNNIAAGLAAGAVGLAAGEALANRRNRSQQRRGSGGTGSMVSPPVSVKLKMHPDGRHITLRRLPEEEAAAERAARAARDRSGSRRPSGDGPVPESWRRTEDRERQEQMEMERKNLQAAQVQLNAGNLSVPLPPPPPIGSEIRRPVTGSVGSAGVTSPGGVGSPGYNESATEASDYANNRRRRRAERAHAKLAREARSGPGVDFE